LHCIFYRITLFSFSHLAEMEQIQETTSKAIVVAKEKSSQAATEAKRIAKVTRVNTVTLLKNPHFQTVTISSGSGAVVLGAVGGVFGSACGAVVGTAAGALPALFTFGLSLPFGFVAGGAFGGATGAVAGGSAGVLAGGAAGHGAFRYRIEIKDGLIYVRKQAISKVEKATLTIKDTATGITTRVNMVCSSTASFALAKASTARLMAAEKFGKVSTGAVAAAKNRRVQVTAGSAAAGTAVCAPLGGIAGGFAGGFAGGVVGLVPAIFTFGLSIPVCAAIGAGMGLCGGAVAGGSAGAVGGGSIGYGSYTYRKEIKDSAQSVQKQLGDTAQATQKKIGEASQATKKRIGETSEVVKARATESVAYTRKVVGGA